MEEIYMNKKISAYIVLNHNKFNNDVYRANSDMKDGISVGRRLLVNGMSDSTISNSKFNANRGTGGIDLSLYENCQQYGVMQKVYFNTICGMYGLNAEDYIVKLKDNGKPANTNTVASVVSADIDARLKAIEDKLENINQLVEFVKVLGNIETQNMEYLKKIADGIQTMNDKYNKPSAYLRR